MPVKGHWILLALCAALALCLWASGAAAECPTPYRFADAAEGAALVLSDDAYMEALNQNDLDYRLQYPGATLNEWQAFAAAQVLEFTEAEKAAVDRAMSRVSEALRANGCALPDIGEITFVKTTMKEEGDIDGYTHGRNIFLGTDVLDYLTGGKPRRVEDATRLVAHELFHCLTRNCREFRAAVYGVIGFDVQPEPFDFGPDVRARMISNPDVDRHDACTAFHIDGREVVCAVVYAVSRPFERPGDRFLDLASPCLVPVDDLNALYSHSHAQDFWDVFGRNTDYAIDPEECLAENFSCALIYGIEGRDWPNPEIMEAVLDCLRA